ncbi:MAG: hypothetical protein IJV54_09895, partial [Bacteroidales bacterium]|nr:hypothetical protein [Bacteroidales bacterium]
MYSNSNKRNKGGKGKISPKAVSHSNKPNFFPEYEGTVQMNRDGNIYVKIKDQDFDIFVKSTKSKGALNGDTVK